MAERMTRVSDSQNLCTQDCELVARSHQTIGAHQEEWQVKFEAANEASRRTVEEGREVAPDVVDLKQEERKVGSGSPYSVPRATGLTIPACRHNSGRCVSYNSLVIKDPEVGYSAAEWNKLFEIWMSMKRDGFYIGTM